MNADSNLKTREKPKKWTFTEVEYLGKYEIWTMYTEPVENILIKRRLWGCFGLLVFCIILTLIQKFFIIAWFIKNEITKWKVFKPDALIKIKFTSIFSIEARSHSEILKLVPGCPFGPLIVEVLGLSSLLIYLYKSMFSTFKQCYSRRKDEHPPPTVWTSFGLLILLLIYMYIVADIISYFFVYRYI